MKKIIAALLLLLVSPSLLAMIELEDEQLAGVSGQALMQMDKIIGDGTTSNGTSGMTFYTAGLDAVLELNLNIKKMQLGCGGINPAGSSGQLCDLDADNFALGCIANAAGICTHAGDPAQTQMKDLVVTRPYFQFAIKNDQSKTLREVVGIRLGGENVNGPMSIGSFNSFSGYLSATANFTMEAQGTSNADDIAVTCGTNVAAGCPGDGGSPGYNDFGLQGPIRSLGLDNGCACLLSVCARYEQLTVGFDEVSRLNRPVLLSGNRQTQAFVSNAQLATAVDEIADSLTVIRSSGLSAGLINLIKGLIIGQVKDDIKQQLADGFGIPVNQLETHQIPYNISNLHSVDIDTPLFGLSFRKRTYGTPAISRRYREVGGCICPMPLS